MRALWLAGACDLLEYRRTNDVTTWRDSRVIKVHPAILAGKDFQNSGWKENEKYPALVEVFNQKQAAEYLKQWEAFTSAEHARSLPGKNYWKLLKCVVESFPREFMNGRGLKLAELDYFHNEIKVSFPLTF